MRHTNKIELVETDIIAKSLGRLREGGGGYDNGRWKRALHHALSMTFTNSDTLRKIREALELP